MGGAEVQLTEDDLVASARLHHRLALVGSRNWVRSGILMAVVVAVAIALVVLAAMPVWVAAVAVPAYALLIIVMLLAMNGFAVPRQARKVFRQQKSLHTPIRYGWSADGFAVRIPTGQSLTPWSHYLKWAEDDRTILLYHSNPLHQIVPKRALGPADAEAIRGWLADAKVPRAGWFR